MSAFRSLTCRGVPFCSANTFSSTFRYLPVRKREGRFFVFLFFTVVPEPVLLIPDGVVKQFFPPRTARSQIISTILEGFFFCLRPFLRGLFYEGYFRLIDRGVYRCAYHPRIIDVDTYICDNVPIESYLGYMVQYICACALGTVCIST